MPKLKNAKEKYVNGLKVDKETKDVVYSDEAHVYLDKTDQQKYVSVTTLIGKYENPFDVFFWSSYKTCEKLMSEETFHVLKETLLATKRWTDDMIEKLHLDPIIFDKTRKEIQKDMMMREINLVKEVQKYTLILKRCIILQRSKI